MCGKLFCWVVVIEMHGSADVLARLSTNSLSDVGAYSNCERLEFRFCPVPASGLRRAATSGQCKSNGYGNINGTAHPHSHIALTLQSSTILTFPQSTRTLALALTATLTRHETSRFETNEQENDLVQLKEEAIVMRWQSHR